MIRMEKLVVKKIKMVNQNTNSFLYNFPLYVTAAAVITAGAITFSSCAVKLDEKLYGRNNLQERTCYLDNLRIPCIDKEDLEHILGGLE